MSTMYEAIDWEEIEVFENREKALALREGESSSDMLLKIIKRFDPTLEGAEQARRKSGIP